MIITSVRFPLPAGTTLEDARKLYQETVAVFQRAQGLIAKHYVVGGGRGGGIYFWETRAAAEAFYTPEWRKAMDERFGTHEIEWLDNPITVDNRTRMTEAA